MTTLPYEEVKALDTVAVAEWSNIEKHRSKRHHWRCPTPGCDGAGDNLRINPRYERGAFCVAGCGAMSNQDIVMAVYGWDYVEATRHLAHAFGLEVDRAPDSQDLARDRARAAEARAKAAALERHRYSELDDETVAKWMPRRAQMLEGLHAAMELGPKGRDYLASRGLDPDMCAHMGVRSVESSRRWRELRELLDPQAQVVVGVAWVKGKRRMSHPSPSRVPFIVFPYFTPEGDFDSLRVRPFGDGESTDGGPKYLSLRMSHNQPRSLFMSSAAELARTHGVKLCICEGEINALSVIQAGGLAVAASGASTWHTEWSKGWEVLRLAVLVDGDRAGSRFAKTVARGVLAQHGSYCVSARLKAYDMGAGKDVNDWLRRGELTTLLTEIGAHVPQHEDDVGVRADGELLH